MTWKGINTPASSAASPNLWREEMNTFRKEFWFNKAAVVTILPITVLGMTGCSTSGSEEGASVEDIVKEPVEKDEIDDPYAGQEQVDSYIGEEVTLSANVNEVISPTSFTIAGTDDTTVDPLLILHDQDLPELKPDMAVQVTGTVREAFDLPRVEEERGVDLEEDLYEDWDREPYIEATTIDTSMATG